MGALGWAASETEVELFWGFLVAFFCQRTEVWSSRGQTKAAKWGLSPELFGKEHFWEMYKKNDLFSLGVGSRRLSGEPLVPTSLWDVNLSWVGKHKELFLPGFLCPVNLPFVWGKITKALPDPSRQEGFGKKLGSWMGQHFVISSLSAVLVLYCQAIWKSPALMCLFSCHRKGSWEYLSSFPGAELRLSDTFRVTQKICAGMRNWPL